ncbi:MAG: hypothetical protein K2Q06_15735 [Parvularculaceae bacterium]|nr:hypothetical protein [Parvularculaceae bacterium]
MSDPALPLTYVDPAYRHQDKFVAAGPVLVLRAARLKWYEIAAPGAPVEEAVRRLAQDSLAHEAAGEGWHLDRELGFLLLHRRAGDAYALTVATWRGSNELRETVYVKPDAAAETFALALRERRHSGGFCVAELGVVAFESAAWKWFLRSPRAASDEEDYLAKRFSGLV